MSYRAARNITPKHWGYRGKEPFFTTNTMVHWDSFLERNFIRLVDFQLEVEELYHQPVCIHYNLDGKPRRYFPDFKMVLSNHQTVLVEVKSKAFFNEYNNIIKYKVGQQYCADKGWLYQVYTEEQIDPGYLQWNLALLRHLGRNGDSNECDRILEVIARQTQITFGDLYKECYFFDESVFYANTYYLIYTRDIVTDLLTKKLSIDSILFLA